MRRRPVRLSRIREEYLLWSVDVICNGTWLDAFGLRVQMVRICRPPGISGLMHDELVRRHFLKQDGKRKKGEARRFVATEQAIQYLLRRGKLTEERAQLWRIKRAGAIVNR